MREHVPFSGVGGTALPLKSCKIVSSVDPVVKGWNNCAVDWELGRCSHSTPGKESWTQSCLTFTFYLFACISNSFFISGTQQAVLHGHSGLPARVLREAREKDADAASLDMRTAIANKQLVITKNIFFEFRGSKCFYIRQLLHQELYWVGLKKKKKKTNSTVFVQKTIPPSFLVILQLKKKNPIVLNTKKRYFDRTPVRHLPAESQKATRRQKGITHTKKKKKYKADTTVNMLPSPWKYSPKVFDRYLLSKSLSKRHTA